MAVVRRGVPTALSFSRTTSLPAWVAVDAKGNLVAGQEAQQLAVARPQAGFFGAKAYLGRPYRDAVKARQHFLGADESGEPEGGGEGDASGLIELRNGEAGVELQGLRFGMHELVGALIAHARSRAQEVLERPVHRAVLSLPPSPRPTVATAYRAACAYANLELVQTVFEPVAAVLSAAGTARSSSANSDDDGPALSLVVDWGAGGLRTTLMRVAGRVCHVLATASDPKLCGAELDRRLLGCALASSKDAPEEPRGFQSVERLRLLAESERVKVALSADGVVTLRVPCAYYADGQPKDISAVVTREQLEGLVRPLLDRGLRLCGQVARRRELSLADVESLVLTGQHTRLPGVVEALRGVCPNARLRPTEPASAVALGAAWVASRTS